MALCWPWWHASFVNVPRTTVSSGCSADSAGNIQCDPDAMRAKAEKWLHDHGFLVGKSLSLDTYTLARNMTSEIGSGTIEEMVAVGQAAVNQGKRHGQSPTQVLLYRTSGVPSYGHYGEIQSGSSGRWASTSQDPTLVSLLLADLITSGQAGDFNKGASDQDGLEYVSAFRDPEQTVRNYAKSRMYWVGPLPGVNPWRTTQWVHVDVAADSLVGAPLLARGLAFARARTQVGNRWVPTVSAETIACVEGAGVSTSMKIIGGVLAGVALLGGAVWLGRRHAAEPMVLP